MNNNPSIKAVIFDLGGVLLNLDYSLTINQFKQLGITDFDSTFTQFNQNELFDDIETGKISPFHFINRILDKLPRGCTGNQVVHAWNAMILDFPKDRMEWLKKFGAKMPIYLFSNTNSIHLDAVKRALHKSVGHDNLDSYFIKAYYSHILQQRKPHPESFLHICAEQGLNPAHTLFIDDSPQHVNGALQAGLQAHLLEKNRDIRELIQQLNLDN